MYCDARRNPLTRCHKSGEESSRSSGSSEREMPRRMHDGISVGVWAVGKVGWVGDGSAESRISGLKERERGQQLAHRWRRSDGRRRNLVKPLRRETRMSHTPPAPVRSGVMRGVMMQLSRRSSSAPSQRKRDCVTVSCTAPNVK